MEKEYIGANTLNMILNGQRSILGCPLNSFEAQKFTKQTIDLLDGFLSGEIEINIKDLYILEDILSALHNTTRGDYRQKAEIYASKIAPIIQKKQEFFYKLNDVNFVAFVLNNKKMARNLTPEELLKAYQTITTNTQTSSRLTSRLEQQINSYALLKYAELKTSRRALSANKKFIDTFNLEHKKVTQISKSLVLMSDTSVAKDTPKSENKFIAFWNKAKNSISKKIDKMRHKIKKFYYKHEAKIAVASFALLGLFGYKMYNMTNNSSPYANNHSFSTNVKSNTYNQMDKTADFTKEAQKLSSNTPNKEVKQDTDTQKTVITGDYFDTALEIHLKSQENVQNLYNKIDALAEDGKIKFADGMNTKKYAHAFTMYNLIRPNSDENKKIQNVLKGGTENPELINRLVLKAKDNGTGVKPDNKSITNSNFDMASKALQQQHLKNLKSLSL